MNGTIGPVPTIGEKSSSDTAKSVLIRNKKIGNFLPTKYRQLPRKRTGMAIFFGGTTHKSTTKNRAKISKRVDEHE